jgi:lipid-A-disaccharide synthase-like uncharacterized protein
MNDAGTLWKMVGYLGLACYFSRMLWQWLASERAGHSVVPAGFWYLSLAGATGLLLYAVSKRDPVYILSLLPGLFIYARNLFLKKRASHGDLWPIAAALGLFILWAAYMEPRDGVIAWTVIGMSGSVIWSGRFIVQWWISERYGRPMLPGPFWLMSLVGNTLLLAYSIHRLDPVFIPGQSFGYIVYIRNLLLIYGTRRAGPAAPID